MSAEAAADFDPVKAVAQYRAAFARLEVETTTPAKDEFRAIVARLRKRWQDWQGEDSLHEMAFGEPIE